jgi:hypothetical protein
LPAVFLRSRLIYKAFVTFYGVINKG